MDLKAPVPVFQWLRLLGLLQKRLRPSCTHLSFSVVWRPAFSCWLWLQLLQHELEGGKCESGKNQNPAQTGGINRNMPLSMLHLCAVTCNLAPPMRRSLMLQRSALQPLFVSLWSIFFSSPPPPPPRPFLLFSAASVFQAPTGSNWFHFILAFSPIATDFTIPL